MNQKILTTEDTEGTENEKALKMLNFVFSLDLEARHLISKVK